jgi:hypothetical protein
VALPSTAFAETIERNRSGEMDMVFHFCRNQVLSNPPMMAALARAGKTLDGMCECIASGFVAAMPNDAIAAAQQGYLTPQIREQLTGLYNTFAVSCSRLPG